jgi:predicted dinucleotide-binding enzyme
MAKSKSKTKVGVIGSGEVGRTLAEGFLKHGYAVMRGSREPQKLEAWRKGAGRDASVGDLAATAKFGEIVVFAVKGTAAEEAVRLAGPTALAGKTVIDAMNPIADAPPKEASSPSSRSPRSRSSSGSSAPRPRRSS